MTADTVSGIRVGGNDLMEDPIQTIYSKVGGIYAIYRTPKRVKI